MSLHHPDSPTSTFEGPPVALDEDLEKQLEHAVAGTLGEGNSRASSRDDAGKTSTPDAPLPPGRLALDDPINPIGWSTSKKILVNAVLNIWVLTLTYASTAYVASIPAIMRHFHVGQTVALLGVTLLVLGFAAGPLILGPASELYGRRPVYLVCGLAYSAFSFGAAFAPNAASLLTFRFIIGFAGSAAINNVPASIGDFTVPATRGPYAIIYAICAFGGPSLGPLCSAFIEVDAGFRWNLRVMAIFSTVLSLCVAFVPETHHPTLVRRRAAKVAALEAPASARIGEVLQVFKVALSRPVVFFCTEPIVLFISIYLSILYGVLYGFFEAFTVVWVEIRGWSLQHYGLTYISLGLGFVVGAALNAILGTKWYLAEVKKALERGETTVPPEARLSLVIPGAIICPISLFLFAWTAPFTHVHWILPCIAEFLFGLSVLLIFTSFIPLLIDSYQAHAASALAAGMASRALIGCVFPLFTLPMYHRLTVQGATSLLGGIACLCAPIPFVFMRIGPDLRRRSKYAAGM
ncbi:hypothetical protein JCM3770_002780 [Rhodotorula araucariae]